MRPIRVVQCERKKGGYSRERGGKSSERFAIVETGRPLAGRGHGFVHLPKGGNSSPRRRDPIEVGGKVRSPTGETDWQPFLLSSELHPLGGGEEPVAAEKRKGVLRSGKPLTKRKRQQQQKKEVK